MEEVIKGVILALGFSAAGGAVLFSVCVVMGAIKRHFRHKALIAKYTNTKHNTHKEEDYWEW